MSNRVRALVVLFSAGLASVTWITPPSGVDFYAYLNPLMSIYHVGMMGLAVVLACVSAPRRLGETTESEIDLNKVVEGFMVHRGVGGV